MPDWNEYVRRNLALPELTREREEQIREDLARQFEQAYSDALARGAVGEEAKTAARAHVPDWESFISDVYRSERRNVKPRLDKWSDHFEARTSTGGVMNSMNRWLSDFRQDLIYGLRSLRKNPGFTVVVVLTLALGIGAVTTVFTLANSVIFHPLPHPNADRILFPWKEKENVRFMITVFPVAEVETLREQSRALEQIESYKVARVVVTDGTEPERVSVGTVSEGLLRLLGATPMLGRLFLPGDYETGAARVIVLSNERWLARYGANPDIVGQKISIENVAHKVIGVLPRGFNFPWREFSYYRPLEMDIVSDEGRRMSVNVMALRRPEFSLTQTQAEMDVLSARMNFTGFGSDNWRIFLRTPDVFVARDFREALLILLGASAFVLLIACANVANLVLARVTGRNRELAIRSALGATRLRVFRQVATETLLLSVLGGLAGAVLSFWLVDLVTALRPAEIRELSLVRIDGRAFAFSSLVPIISGIFFGLLPAWRGSRVGINRTLNTGSRSQGGSVPRGRFRNGLIVTEMALSVILLIGASLLISSFLSLTHKDMGFRGDNLLTLQLTLNDEKYAEGPARAAFFDALRERVAGVPSATEFLIADGVPPRTRFHAGHFDIADRELDESEMSQYFAGATVEPGYFRMLGIPLVEGRRFTDLDPSELETAAIINRSTAKRFWPGESALGKQFQFGDKTWRTVTGIIGILDAGDIGRNPERNQQLFTPLNRWDRSFAVLMINSKADPAKLAPLIKSLIWELDPNQPVGTIQTIDDLVDTALAKQRFNMYIMSLFAGLALVLALVGLYGVLSYATAQRTHEIGVRVALGATAANILRMVIGRGMFLVSSGMALGLIGSFWLTRLLNRFLFGVTATDPATFLAVSVLLLSVALAACYIPARRATKVDPMVALRYE